ncbi:hypothetical protein D3C86_1610500 [compost metagenome]
MRQGKRQRRADANGAARFGGLAGDALLHLLDFAEQAQGGFVVTLPERRDVQASGRTIEQAHAEAFLKLHQASADELLGQAQLIGGGREAAGIHHLAKNTHVFERVHCHALVDGQMRYSGFYPFQHSIILESKRSQPAAAPTLECVSL